MPNIKTAPLQYDATIEEIFDNYLIAVMPSPAVVEKYHRLLYEYIHDPRAKFFIRAIGSLIRGQEYQSRMGIPFVITDNSPAWWMHYNTFHEVSFDFEEFIIAVHNMPTHMFNVVRLIPSNINSAGWHVAHIYDVKNRDVTYNEWPHEEFVRRFIRNVHPCNCFYFPKTRWRRWGGDKAVLAYVADRYSQRYGDVWKEFADVAQLEPLVLTGVDPSYRITSDTTMLSPQRKPGGAQ